MTTITKEEYEAAYTEQIAMAQLLWKSDVRYKAALEEFRRADCEQKALKARCALLKDIITKGIKQHNQERDFKMSAMIEVD